MSETKTAQSLSPNHDGRNGTAVSMVVLHYTGMKTGEEAFERLCDPEAKVSAHYLIGENGRIRQLVPEERRAWHAGVSEWAGTTDVNAASIGIELVNPGHEWGYRDFPEAQIDALIGLMGGLRERWNVPRSRIVGHSDVAPDRKEDPGEKFPWRALAAEGLAVPSWDRKIPETLPDEAEAPKLLANIGYAVERFGFEACLTAFQRRFCPSQLGEGLTEGSLAAMAQTCAWLAGKRR